MYLTREEMLIYQIIQLEQENQKLKNDQEKMIDHMSELKWEVAELKRELRKPERMTNSENLAYWGIFGQGAAEVFV